MIYTQPNLEADPTEPSIPMLYTRHLAKPFARRESPALGSGGDAFFKVLVQNAEFVFDPNIRPVSGEQAERE